MIGSRKPTSDEEIDHLHESRIPANYNKHKTKFLSRERIRRIEEEAKMKISPKVESELYNVHGPFI